MALLLKFGLNISRYTKFFFVSGIGLLVGARLFGMFSGIFGVLAIGEQITWSALEDTGIVFYGGLFGFAGMFLLAMKILDKKINYILVDIIAVCIPLFHAFGRLGCFFAGCCFGAESISAFAVSYTNVIGGELVTAYRVPVQLLESTGNLLVFVTLIYFLFMNKMQNRLLLLYFSLYSILRVILEMFRGDAVRGVWNGVSFGQIISVIVFTVCAFIFIINHKKEWTHGDF